MQATTRRFVLLRLALLPFACCLVSVTLEGAAPSVPQAGSAPDPALTPPAINTAPGPEYADSTRCFQGIPSIERAPSGRLWAVWYGGGNGEGAGNYVMLATSVDNGKTWSQVSTVIDPDGSGSVRAFDPAIWCDPLGRLWVFWAQASQAGATPAWVFAAMTEHPEQEHPAWSKPRRICDGIMLNKPTVLSTGEWCLPAAVWHTDGSSRVVGSTDHGATFHLVGQANIEKRKRGCDEHMIVERKDGSLWILVRWHEGVGQSVSTDRGKTWTEVTSVPAAMQQQPSRFHIRRLPSGNLLLVKNSPPEGGKKRTCLTAYVSTDDGKTWDGGLLLEEGASSYPDAAESPDGTIYVIYDHERTGAKQILMAAFTEQDVLQKQAVSAKARLHVLVNQATGQRVRPHKQPKAPKK